MLQERAIRAPTAKPAATSQSHVGNLCQSFIVASLSSRTRCRP